MAKSYVKEQVFLDCRGCGNQFLKTRTKQSYCGPLCWKNGTAYKNSKLRTCKHTPCSNLFLPKEHRKYCCTEHEQFAVRVYTRRWYLKDVYGITLEEYLDIHAKQSGRCAICRDVVELLCVDHDHRTGLIRGLLCRACNLGLGHFCDDPVKLRTAADYLDQNSGQSS